MLWSFWQRSQYGTVDPADVPGCPAELNPYKKFLIRMAFADLKVIACMAIGIGYGAICWIVYAATGKWFMP